MALARAVLNSCVFFLFAERYTVSHAKYIKVQVRASFLDIIVLPKVGNILDFWMILLGGILLNYNFKIHL